MISAAATLLIPPTPDVPSVGLSPAVLGATRRCVWTSHPRHDRHCRARIPAGVVAEAWWRARREDNLQEGFFRFLWNGREWLGYGLKDGRVRGVYCPEHSAERDSRDARVRRPDPARGREEQLTLVE